MNLSMRARLSLIAAGVVAAALAVGGLAWIELVDSRMVDALRARDQLRIAHEVVLGSVSSSLPDPQRRSGSRGTPRRRPRGRSFGPPTLLFGSDTDLLVIRADGQVEFSGQDAELQTDLGHWLSTLRDQSMLAGAERRVAELTAEFHRLRRKCRPPSRKSGGGPPPSSSCRKDVDAARDLALARATEFEWPDQIVVDAMRGRQIWTGAWSVDSRSGANRAIGVASSLAVVDATGLVLMQSLLIGGPIMVIFVVSVTWILVGRSLREVHRIQSEAEKIAFGVLDQRLEPPASRDEIAALVDTLNRMLDRLASGAKRQRAFIGDASHELRTPISTLRAQLEVALAHPELADWPKVASQANDEALRMQRLVEDLLQIARLDDSPEDRRRLGEVVDLDDVIVGECAALTQAKVDCSCVSPIRIRGREADLRRVLRNLLENAERYGHGRVQVSLRRSGDLARIEVEDDGPGIALADRDRVFERFTRLDESRSRMSGGAGLGLALCKGLVEAHGGSIEIDDARLGGARFVVLLPIGN